MRKIPVILVQALCVAGLCSVPLVLAQSGATTPSLPPWLTAAWHQSLLATLLPTILTGTTPATLLNVPSVCALRGLWRRDLRRQ
jgi:hypothetical protein